MQVVGLPHGDGKSKSMELGRAPSKWCDDVYDALSSIEHMREWGFSDFYLIAPEQGMHSWLVIADPKFETPLNDHLQTAAGSSKETTQLARIALRITTDDRCKIDAYYIERVVRWDTDEKPGSREYWTVYWWERKDVAA